MDANAKKTALRMVSYGLYVVTTRTENERGACLVNWLTQCSFEPPMIVIAFEKAAHTLKVLQASGRFVVNVLETSQRELAGWFGRHHDKVGDKLANRVTQASPAGGIVLPEALSWFECVVRGQTDVGDHLLVIGEVVDAGVQREGTPLSLKETGFRYAG
jgi:flavin reductase (DIM6/NTAB) family NADH-FMN oxidoreductase RutF